MTEDISRQIAALTAIADAHAAREQAFKEADSRRRQERRAANKRFAEVVRELTQNGETTISGAADHIGVSRQVMHRILKQNVGHSSSGPRRAPRRPRAPQPQPLHPTVEI